MSNWNNEMKFRTTSGAIINRDPLAEAPSPLGLADPAAERGVGQVEPVHLLRKQIEGVIREYGYPFSVIDKGSQ